MAPRKNVLLKSKIFAAGLTQRELSERAGVPENVLSMIVNGRYIASAAQQGKIAEALGVNAEDVFGCEGE